MNQVTPVSLFVAFNVIFWTSLWLLSWRFTFLRKQWRKFKRLSRAGPFYRAGVFLIAEFWRIISWALWRMYGAEFMDTTPPHSSIPKLTLTTKTLNSLTISWIAKPSSYYSRDSYQLQVRGCVGPLSTNNVTQWHNCFHWTVQADNSSKMASNTDDQAETENRNNSGNMSSAIFENDATSRDDSAIATASTNKMFQLNGLDPGQCLEFRCRTVNSKGSSEWSAPSLRAYTRQPPVKGGGHGVGFSHYDSSSSTSINGNPFSYVWRQSGRYLHIFVKLPYSNVRARDLDFKISSKRIKITLTRRGTASEELKGENGAESMICSFPMVLVEGAFFRPVIAENHDWDIRILNGDGSNQLNGRYVVVELEKEEATFKRTDHWPQVFVGHPTIDTGLLPNLIEESTLADP